MVGTRGRPSVNASSPTSPLPLLCLAQLSPGIGAKERLEFPGAVRKEEQRPPGLPSTRLQGP